MSNRDLMADDLRPVYGPANGLADWEGQHWVANGFPPAGPGNKAAWYAANGAVGSSYGDLERDYWLNRYGGAQHPFAALGATWWIDAALEPQTGTGASTLQYVLNRGDRRVPHARRGSAGRAELRGSFGLILPGVTGNWASAPDAAPLRVTGDIDLLCRVSLVDWTPVGPDPATLIGKRAGAPNFAYQFRVAPTTGRLEFVYGDTPTTVVTVSSTVSPVIADGAPLWVRVTRASGTGVVQFFTAPDDVAVPTAWTQLGTNVSTTAGAINAGTEILGVGNFASGATEVLQGTMFRAIVRNGIGGTAVFDANFTAAPAFAASFTESSANAATVTINATSGADTNDPLLLTHTGTNYLYMGPGGGSTTPTDNNFCVSAISASGTTVDMRVHLRRNDDDLGNGICATWLGNGFAQAFTLAYDFATRAVTSTLFDIAGPSGTASITGDLWLRLTHDFATNASNISESTNGVSWTTVASGTFAASNRGGNEFSVNTSDVLRRNGSNHSTYQASLTVGGTLVTSFDASLRTGDQSSWVDPQGRTWTLNRAPSGRKAVMVTRPVILFGTDDFLEVPDNPLLNMGASQSFTAVVIHRKWINAGTGFERLVEKASDASANDGWSLNVSGSTPTSIRPNSGIDSGANTVSHIVGSGDDNGQARLYAMTVDRAAQLLNTWRGNTPGTAQSTAAVGTLVNSFPMRIGRIANGVPNNNNLDGEIFAVAIFRTALSSTQLGQIATHFGV
jgi:hypothetical protein